MQANCTARHRRLIRPLSRHPQRRPAPIADPLQGVTLDTSANILGFCSRERIDAPPAPPTPTPTSVQTSLGLPDAIEGVGVNGESYRLKRSREGVVSQTRDEPHEE